VSGAARISPTRAEQGAARDRHDQHREWVDAEGGAHRERLDDPLEDAVGDQLDDNHAGGSVGAGTTECNQDRERPRGPGADVGDVGAERGDRDDRADSGTPRAQAPTATTAELKAATTPRK
jgi:hypothetical protein